MTAMTTRYMNDYRYDLEDNALAIGIADVIAIEQAEEAEREKAWEERQGDEGLLNKLMADLDRYAAEGNREAWERCYDFFSDVSKDVYGFRWRLTRPWKDEV